ncbi:MAG: hypothetical protein ABI467_15205 [Kofleriaceae bacterium]
MALPIASTMTLCFVVLVACSGSDDVPTRPEPLAALPLPAPANTDRFVDSPVCGQCHLVGDTATALHDATGANVSPVLLWRSSMMALAARDPYYLASFAEEAAAGKPGVEALCTRCHSPAGSEERDTVGQHLGFADLTTGDDPASRLARDGVTCTACHQIDPTNLGDEQSFSGGFTIGFGRKIYGPYLDPRTSPMMLIVNYTPTGGAHITKSELCATCHTVIIPTTNGSITEQGTYLEWRSSSFRAMNQQCQTCHVPTIDATGATIVTQAAGSPADLNPRSPIGKHVFVGGNSYVLSLIADGLEWSGSGLSADELAASVARDQLHLTTAAHITIGSITRAGDAVSFPVHVQNLTGHKLPTGYPSRRMWIHLTVTAGGATVFESGGVDATGALVDAAGTVLPAQPHRDTVASSDEVQVWEAAFVDRLGQPTHRTTEAAHYSKDDRILPAGFAPSPTDATRISPVGVIADPTFVPGSDDVTYTLAGIPTGATITATLSFQVLRPELVEAVEASSTPAGSRFVDLARARPDLPVVMAEVSASAP